MPDLDDIYIALVTLKNADVALWNVSIKYIFNQ
jgi:hypothetical protein